jgi:hypothetical protein
MSTLASLKHSAHHEDENPQSAATPTRRKLTTIRSSYDDVPNTASNCWKSLFDFMSDPVKELVHRDVYNIALVIYDCSFTDLSISAIRSPVSTCRVASLTVLNNNNANNNAGETSSSFMDNVKAWLEMYSINPDETEVLQGDEGFAETLKRDSVDAVYLYVPPDIQCRFTLDALQAGKHVLVKDVVSTPSKDFREQLDYAQAAGRFIQFSTMFVHNYRAQSFLDCVCSKKTFGSIQEIDAILIINYQDLDAINISLPLSPGQGCVRRLARYCVLVSTLMLRANHFPVRATVTEHVADDTTGEPIAAKCQVEFNGGVVLKCNVVYSEAATRQVLTVRSGTNKFATMTDFLIPHRDGLATYRVYDKELNKLTGLVDVIQGGECIDVPTGPPQDVSLWREFHQLCSSVERFGWTDAEETREARILTESALQTKRILMALDESFQNNGAPVDIKYRASSLHYTQTP